MNKSNAAVFRKNSDDSKREKRKIRRKTISEKYRMSTIIINKNINLLNKTTKNSSISPIKLSDPNENSIETATPIFNLKQFIFPSRRNNNQCF